MAILVPCFANAITAAIEVDDNLNPQRRATTRILGVEASACSSSRLIACVQSSSGVVLLDLRMHPIVCFLGVNVAVANESLMLWQERVVVLPRPWMDSWHPKKGSSMKNHSVV